MSSEVDQASNIDAVIARAKNRWPKVTGSRENLLRHVEALGTRCGNLELHGDELQLACACLHGDEPALLVLEREYVSRVGASLVRFGTQDDFIAEVTQLLRQRLLLPPEPRLATYAATGPLLTWMRVVSVRLGLSLRRSTPPATAELMAEHLLDVPCVDASEVPRYRQAVDAAVRRAFGELPIRERNLLRLHYLDGLSLDQLGVLNAVHRATVARWLADLRRRVLVEVEKEVSLQLKLSPSEFRSVLGMVRSRLDASFGRLLDATETAT